MNNKLSALIFSALSLAALTLAAVPAYAGCFLYKGQHGGDVIGRVENGVVYKEMYNLTSLARAEGSLVYDGAYSYNILGHFEGLTLYKERFGDTPMGRISDHGLIYKAGDTSTVLGRVEGCQQSDAAALGIALLSGLF